MISPEITVTLVVMVITTILFATEWINIGVTAIAGMLALTVFGVISPKEALEGFTTTAIITVAFMFILSDTVLRTGALQHFAFSIEKNFSKNFKRSLFVMMLIIALASAFINNTPVVAIFIPVVIQLAYSTKTDARKLLIPLSFASIFGGTCTLIGTSTNLLIDSLAQKQGFSGLSLFAPAGVGVILLLAGTCYVVFIGIHVFSRKKDKTGTSNFSHYHVELETQQDYPEKTITSEIQKLRLPLSSVTHSGHKRFRITCTFEELTTLLQRLRNTPSIFTVRNSFSSTDSETSITEVSVPYHSELEGKTLAELNYIKSFRARPLGLAAIRSTSSIWEHPLHTGDKIIFQVRRDHLESFLQLEKSVRSPITFLSKNHIIDFNRGKFLFILLVFLLLFSTTSIGLIDFTTGSLYSVILLVISRQVKIRQLFTAVNWKVILLLGGAYSIGIAMSNSGIDQILANAILENLTDYGPVVVLSAVYLLTSILTEFMTNHAAAAMITPLSLLIAQKMGVAPEPFVITVLFASSASFMTPTGYHANTMVYGVGNYRYADFLKIGIPLNLLFWLLSTLLIPLFFPF